MAERKSFLLRIDRGTLDAVQRWANDDLRSLNGQIEFLLRRALQVSARAPKGSSKNSVASNSGVADTAADADAFGDADAEAGTDTDVRDTESE